MLVIEILILTILWLTALLFAAGVGFFVGRNGAAAKKHRRQTETAYEQKKAAERSEQEFQNMLSYDGSEQEEIE